MPNNKTITKQFLNKFIVNLNFNIISLTNFQLRDKLKETFQMKDSIQISEKWLRS